MADEKKNNELGIDIEAIKDQADRPVVRGSYIKISPDDKLRIAMSANQIGIDATIEANSNLRLKYNTVKDWMNKYNKARATRGIDICTVLHNVQISRLVLIILLPLICALLSIYSHCYVYYTLSLHNKLYQ